MPQPDRTAGAGIRPDPAAADDLLIDHARAWWQIGDWDRLAALDDARIAGHADRDRLALLAAAGCFQTGAADRARRLIRRARDWGCDRDLLARVLISGACNSLGRAASLNGDEPRAAGLFETAITLVDRRADPQVAGRTRNLHEKARLGQLPEAAKLLKVELEAMSGGPPTSARERMFSVQVDLINSQLAQALRRGQDTTVTPASGGGATDPAARSVAQLGQDLWVLERTGRKHGGFFVEFGATDGVLFSNTLLLETGFDWTGICAEPNPAFFEKLRRNRHCIVSRDCIYGCTGAEVEFVLADEYGGIAEFAGIDKHADKRLAFREAGQVLRLPTISLDDFLKKYRAPRQIDYLSIDTEGSEYEILRHFPFDAWDIRLITVEHNFAPDRERIRALLEAQGYRRTEVKWDDWYERPDLGDPETRTSATGDGKDAAI